MSHPNLTLKAAPAGPPPLSYWIGAAILMIPSIAEAASRKSQSEREEKELLLKANYILDQCFEMGWKPFAIYTLIATIIAFLLFWPCSKFFAGRKADFMTNLRYLGYVTAGTTFLLIVAIIALRAGSMSIAAAATGLGMTIMVVDMARKTFEVSIGPAIGIWFCVALTGAVGSLAADATYRKMPWTEFEEKSKEEQKQLIAEWRAKQKEQKTESTPAPSSTPTIASVQEMYANLERTRATLDANDPQAVARFNDQVAAYNAAKAAIAPPPATPVPTKPATPKSEKKKTVAKGRES